MTWRIQGHWGIYPDSNARRIPLDPQLALEDYMAGGSDSTSYLINRPLNVEVPREYWVTSKSPGAVHLLVETCYMPELTGEDEADFKGFPWSVCFVVACLGFQSERFMQDIRSHAGTGPLEPWFIWDAYHGGHAAPLFQFAADTEEVAFIGAQMTVPWVEDNFDKLMRAPINRCGSHGYDWLRGDLAVRPALANLIDSMVHRTME